MGRKVVVLGSGARQAAIAWKLAQAKNVSRVIMIPGSIVPIEGVENMAIPLDKLGDILDFCQKNDVSYVMTGDGEMLSKGVVNFFQSHDVPVFGPSKKAAQLESSKTFAKEFMNRHGIPTVSFSSFDSYEEAKEHIESRQEGPLVVKADGLVRGRGVSVCQTKEEGLVALSDMMSNDLHGEAGRNVVIEDFISGPEISLHILTDTKTYRLFPFAQDHKPLKEGNVGPNTGGMGTYAPVDWISKELEDEITQKIILPTLRGMKADGIDYTGLLFPGLMLTPRGPMVLEYNTRFGAPETQSFMMLFDGDLDELLYATITKKLSSVELQWKQGYAATVEVVSGQYPEELDSTKTKITLDKSVFDGQYFLSGALLEEDQLFAVGGKIVSVSAFGKTLDEALEKAYVGVNGVNFEGMNFRKDIGRLENKVIRIKE